MQLAVDDDRSTEGQDSGARCEQLNIHTSCVATQTVFFSQLAEAVDADTVNNIFAKNEHTMRAASHACGTGSIPYVTSIKQDGRCRQQTRAACAVA